MRINYLPRTCIRSHNFAHIVRLKLNITVGVLHIIQIWIDRLERTLVVNICLQHVGAVSGLKVLVVV